MKCGLSVRLGVQRKDETDSPDNASSSATDGAREVYFELYVVGDSVKVSAVDGETGIEVSIVGSAKLPQAELERVALNKLHYVMKRKAGESDQPDAGAKPTSDGKGWVV